MRSDACFRVREVVICMKEPVSSLLSIFERWVNLGDAAHIHLQKVALTKLVPPRRFISTCLLFWTLTPLCCPSCFYVSHNLTPILALVDSGSSDCFIDSTYGNEHALSPYPMFPVQLQLFDGTMNSTITQAIDLSLRFQSSDITPMTLYVTSLDGSYSLVLGHNWLACHNLLIDWDLSSNVFRSPEQPILVPPNLSLKPPNSLPLADPTPDVPPSFSQCKAPPIMIISTPTFTLACHLQGLVQFSLQIRTKESDL